MGKLWIRGKVANKEVVGILVKALASESGKKFKMIIKPAPRKSPSFTFKSNSYPLQHLSIWLVKFCEVFYAETLR